MILFYWIPFIAGIATVFILLYKIKQDKRIIYDYPQPHISNTYIDKNGISYTYLTNVVDCDQHEHAIKQYPLQ